VGGLFDQVEWRSGDKGEAHEFFVRLFEPDIASETVVSSQPLRWGPLSVLPELSFCIAVGFNSYAERFNIPRAAEIGDNFLFVAGQDLYRKIFLATRVQNVPNRPRRGGPSTALHLAAETLDQHVPYWSKPIHESGLAKRNPDFVNKHISALEICDFEVPGGTD
jgi:hypothetical protein